MSALSEADASHARLMSVTIALIDDFIEEARVDQKSAAEALREQFLSDEFLVLQEEAKFDLLQLGLVGTASRELMHCWMSRQNRMVGSAKQVMNQSAVEQYHASQAIKTMQTILRADERSSCGKLVGAAKRETPIDWTTYALGAVAIATLVGVGYLYVRD